SDQMDSFKIGSDRSRPEITAYFRPSLTALVLALVVFVATALTGVEVDYVNLRYVLGVCFMSEIIRIILHVLADRAA
ncbi:MULTISPECIES: hypothetical protein, partial [unclassified Pseudomonas]|uniref:hypothetical protein n=1 Tax=unclassified Pseudomonas TaxID=196821 RepID=UPI003F9BA090